MKKMVVGFMFDRKVARVVLIRKNRPAWMAGLCNGIGGKVEGEETPVQAMVREFREETTVVTQEGDWSEFLHLVTDHNTNLYFFTCVSDLSLDDVMSNTDETVIIDHVRDLHVPVLRNLHWILPLAWYNATYQEIHLSGNEGKYR